MDLDKEDFVGRASVLRTNEGPLDTRLVGLEMESPAPIEGAVIWDEGEYAGYVTSSAESPALGKAVMLGWVATRDEEGTQPEVVTIDGREARPVPVPFYDPEGSRARAVVSPPEASEATVAAVPAVSSATSIAERRLEPVALTRVVATEAAIAELAAGVGTGTLVLPVAPDEILIAGPVTPDEVADAHAIVEPETGFAAAWFPAAEAAEILASTCEWALPAGRPAFAQGAVADLPVKLWLTDERVLFVVQCPFISDLQQRLDVAVDRS